MKLNSIVAPDGAKHDRKRVGRGVGSGLGKTSGKGHKGQNARSGGGVSFTADAGRSMTSPAAILLMISSDKTCISADFMPQI